MRWHDPDAAQALSCTQSLPELGFYAGMAVALLMRNEAMAERARADLARAMRPQPGTLYLHNGETRVFGELRDADDAIGQMLEVYLGSGLLYAPFSWLYRVEFLPPRNFVDMLVPKVQLTTRDGEAAYGFCPLLYCGSSTHSMDTVRAGRMTLFDNIGRARRGIGQRDFVVDGGTLMGMQNIVAIEFAE